MNYKVTMNPPAGNIISQQVEHPIAKVEVKAFDRRTETEDTFTMFFELEEYFDEDQQTELKRKTENILNSLGYQLMVIINRTVELIQYDAGIALIKSKQK